MPYNQRSKGVRVIKKLIKRKSTKQQELPTRITNDTVAQHREKILAGGRKHKYPLQYTRHTLIWNTIIISLMTLVVVAIILWVQLYVVRSTSDLAYRITRVLPLPVASVDGETVYYRDYLLYQRTAMTVLKGQGKDVAEDEAAFQRQRSMDLAVRDAYVRKKARELNITVSRDQVDSAIDRWRKRSDLSDKSDQAVIDDSLRWTVDEFRSGIEMTLLAQAVAFALDKPAAELSQQIESALKEGVSPDKLAEQFTDRVALVPPEKIPLNNADGGLSEVALKLKPGQTSSAVKTSSGDGYYFVTLVSQDNLGLTYSYIKVPLRVFSQELEQLKKDNKIKHYISLNK